MKILDTDTCVAILRGQPGVLERRAADPDLVCTTWMTAAELYFGAAKSIAPAANRERVASFLSSMEVLRPGPGAAAIFGEAKAMLQRAGAPVADADLTIAAICLAEGATLVTGNLRHFSRLPGLRVVDWIRPAPD